MRRPFLRWKRLGFRLVAKTWKSPPIVTRRWRICSRSSSADPLDRQVILAYLEDLDAESIAEITGLSVANVWTKIHRIKDVLVRQFHRGGRDGL